jgi:hypothetical protein
MAFLTKLLDAEGSQCAQVTKDGALTVVPLAGWSVSEASSANTAKTITKTASATQQHIAMMVDVTVSGAAAGSDIAVQLKDDTTIKWQTSIASGTAEGTRIVAEFPTGIVGTLNKNMTLTAGAGGAGCVMLLTLHGYSVTA